MTQKELRKVKLCAEWLKFCLSIGWQKEHLDLLEKLWMDMHDDDGNILSLPASSEQETVRLARYTKGGLK